MQIRDRRVRIVVIVFLIGLIGTVLVYGITVALAEWERASALQALERYDYRQAASHLEKSLWWRAGSADVQMLAAQTARRRGDFEGVNRHLRLAVKAGAPRQFVDTESGLLAIQLGDLTNAPGLTELCDANPTSAEATIGIEVLFEGSLNSFQLAQARQAVDTWLAHRTGKFDQAHALVWRARLHQVSGDIPQALADYQKALEKDPDHAEAHFRLADTLIREDSLKAVPHVAWMKNRHPNDVEVRLLSVRLNRALGQLEEAERLADKLVESAPDHVHALVERGRIAMDLGKPREGAPFLRRALDQRPNFREACLAMADCLRQLGHFDEAKRYQDQAISIEEYLKKKQDESSRGNNKG